MRSAPPSSTRPSDDVLTEAAQWYALLRSGQAGARETARWRAWLAAAAEHRAAWRDVQAIDQGMAALQGAPDPRAAADHLLAAQSRLRSRRRVLAGAAGLAIMGSGGWLAARATLPPGGPVSWFADVKTAVGEHHDQVLADGTRIWLNTASAIDVDYTGTLRRIVLLAGEIFIDTGVDAARAFVVDTPQGRLQALGTRFNVRTEGDTAQVAVFDGRVQIQPADGPQALVLAPGEQTTLTRTGVAAPGAADPAHEAWTNGMLLVNDAPLSEVVQTLRRHRRGQVRLADTVADLRVYGSFPLHDTDRALAMLAATLPIAIHRPWPWSVVIEPR